MAYDVDLAGIHPDLNCANDPGAVKEDGAMDQNRPPISLNASIPKQHT